MKAVETMVEKGGGIAVWLLEGRNVILKTDARKVFIGAVVDEEKVA